MTLRTPKEFIDAGLVPAAAANEIDKVAEQFSAAITPQMQAQIKSLSPDDPIAKQFVPSVEELTIQQKELFDPIGDDIHTPVKGVIHRYPDRCLLKPVNVCPVYCRFCFRREKVGPGNDSLTPDELELAYRYIAGNKNIWEVILTGGDPLILKAKKLASILSRLDEIEHVGVVRLHTRIPVVDPGRVSEGLIAAMKLTNKPTYVVIHANHPDEFSPAAVDACARLVDAGIPLLSQTVLLKSINDNKETMSRLMRTFIKNRIKPYYLHHADLAKGTSHFRTSIEEGRALMKSILGDLSGICQPTYVLDIPGGHGKVPLTHCYLHEIPASKGEKKEYHVEDYRGNFHHYVSDG